MYYIIMICPQAAKEIYSSYPETVCFEVYSLQDFMLCFFPENMPDVVLLHPKLPEVACQKIENWLHALAPDARIIKNCTFFSNFKALSPARRTDLFSLRDSLDFFHTLTTSSAADSLRTRLSSRFGQYAFFTVVVHAGHGTSSAPPMPDKASLLAKKLLLKASENAIIKYPHCISYLTDHPSLVLVFWQKQGDRKLLETERLSMIETCAMQKTPGHMPPAVCHFGTLHSGIFGIYTSYLEACETYYVDRLRSKSTIYEEISEPRNRVQKPARLVEIERSIRTDMEFCKGNNTLSYVQKWFEECKRQNYTLLNVKCDTILLYSNIKNIIFDMYVLRPQRIKTGLEVYEILEIGTIDEIQEWFNIWLTYTLNNFEPVHTGSEFDISEVLEFIQSHLTDGLTLEKISSYFFLSPPYFSTRFKKETGQTFISYLTGKKMERAFALLKENHKVYEVAHMLGYEDLRHFRNLYKKHFGISPAETRLKDSSATTAQTDT